MAFMNANENRLFDYIKTLTTFLYAPNIVSRKEKNRIITCIEHTKDLWPRNFSLFFNNDKNYEITRKNLKAIEKLFQKYVRELKCTEKSLIESAKNFVDNIMFGESCNYSAYLKFFRYVCSTLTHLSQEDIAAGFSSQEDITVGFAYFTLNLMPEYKYFVSLCLYPAHHFEEYDFSLVQEYNLGSETLHTLSIYYNSPEVVKTFCGNKKKASSFKNEIVLMFDKSTREYLGTIFITYDDKGNETVEKVLQKDSYAVCPTNTYVLQAYAAPEFGTNKMKHFSGPSVARQWWDRSNICIGMDGYLIGLPKEDFKKDVKQTSTIDAYAEKVETEAEEEPIISCDETDLISLLPEKTQKKLEFIKQYIANHSSEEWKAHKINIFYLPEYAKIRTAIDGYNEYPNKETLTTYRFLISHEKSFLEEFDKKLDFITEHLFEDECMDAEVSVTVAKQLNEDNLIR